ncbi:immune inhibitor A [Shewanella sp. AS1]|uniref:immune inhibitor A domain-containing protein n=1 Tax=Shewanella sp. AS1 TaxID=2907626 RepID=UPI001F3D388B|nr:immune inhibitor A domain-containing protein [Shewanella sp. AS1]MCE9680539.1 immune inhibitor A [Shewanella sp. AS1]
MNKTQILYWLTKRGELSPDASEAQKQEAFELYISKASHFRDDAMVIESKLKRQNAVTSSSKESSRLQKVGAMVTVLSDREVSKTVKVLGVLIDFPDLLHNDNRLSSSDTPMYYPSYPLSHYYNLMFSSSGFTGPFGENLLSAYQYYQAESGGSFFYEGDVKGWYTASNNAAYYGANNPSNNNDDVRVPELVQEAVTFALYGMSQSELDSYDIEDPYDLDGDGNYDEADGIIDHVTIFHSSIGEESGGGVLGDNAIWSHRYYVYGSNDIGETIPGTNKKVFGYTIQPIDAAAGVVAHEFGHDLGLPDEYDTSGLGDGSPVGMWSIMASGSWAGDIPGAHPVGFSPYARSYLQENYKGKWLNETKISLNAIPVGGQEVNLVEAVNHNQVNQLSIPLPPEAILFRAPYSGQYQYYSGQGNLINQSASFDLNLPASASLILSMKAHWKIELDYDYVQVLIDGVPLAGNHTKAVNSINSAEHIITGQSANIAGAEGSNAWVDLTFDLTAYAGGNHQISFIYKTDEFVGDYGFVMDDIRLLENGQQVYFDGAETAGVMTLDGFTRIDNYRQGGDRRYVVQLRSYNGVDVGLQSFPYEPGVLLWFENKEEVDNGSSGHPGEGLIGVVDADQVLISSWDTEGQIRDATFSLYNQSAFFGDNHLNANNLFDDSLDYSAPLKPQAGIKLPALGLTMEVVTQATDSTQALVRFEYTGDEIELPASELLISIATTNDNGSVSFTANVSGGDGNYTYQWDFGVAGASSTLASPTHTYSEAGQYLVTLTVTDGSGNTQDTVVTILVELPPVAAFSFVANQLQVSFSDATTLGVGALSYQWDFGDGSNSVFSSPSHTYDTAGTYTVVLNVTDSNGNTSSATQEVTVSSAASQSSGGSGGGGSLGGVSLILLMVLACFRRLAGQG